MSALKLNREWAITPARPVPATHSRPSTSSAATYERARAEFLAVLGLERELGDRAGETGTRHELARIDLERGDYERARAEYLAVLELERELGDRTGEAAARNALAHIDDASASPAE